MEGRRAPGGARTPYGWQHGTWSSSSEGRGAVETPRPGREKLGARVTSGRQEHAQHSYHTPGWCRREGVKVCKRSGAPKITWFKIR
eukprot:scaffold8287_cov28-Phaeocystis_antarctica.AAC.1